jgi:hypothetical protein
MPDLMTFKFIGAFFLFFLSAQLLKLSINDVIAMETELAPILKILTLIHSSPDIMTATSAFELEYFCDRAAVRTLAIKYFGILSLSDCNLFVKYVVMNDIKINGLGIVLSNVPGIIAPQ